MPVEHPVSHYRSRLASAEGLCTSVAYTDEMNAHVIRTILDVWLEQYQLERLPRNPEFPKWETVYDMPLDFANYRYRVAVYGGS